MVAALKPATSSLVDTERSIFEYIGSPSLKYRLGASFSADDDDDDITCTPPAVAAALLRASAVQAAAAVALYY